MRKKKRRKRKGAAAMHALTTRRTEERGTFLLLFLGSSFQKSASESVGLAGGVSRRTEGSHAMPDWKKKGAHLASPPLSSCVRSVGPFLRLMQGKQSEAKPRGYGIVEGAPPRRCWFSFSVKVFIALPSRPPSHRGSPHLNKKVAEQKEERRRRGLETGRGREGLFSDVAPSARGSLSLRLLVSLSLFGGAFYFVARFQEEGGTVARIVKWGRKEERETMMLCGGKLRKCLSTFFLHAIANLVSPEERNLMFAFLYASNRAELQITIFLPGRSFGAKSID